MEDLLRDRLPHAPQMGLFVVPDLPADRLDNALSDYARDVKRDEVLALYDATLSGTGGDGAVFARDRFVFQNNNLQATQTVRYSDLVGVKAESRWLGLGGKLVTLTVNRGRATFELSMDFSGAPEAASYVATFLDAAMVEDIDFTPAAEPDATDVTAVRDALQRLRTEQKLTEVDFSRLMAVLESDSSEEES
ncbi:MAG: hypothetical protein BRD28_03525 [Bacteroidetes bacterium QH_10_64_37]|nr:MAG: hypothetical protein BRD28_03525 [Bacteroidetes bacterium QH_10_64_37]